jgi:hypothetical protein
MHWHSEVGGNIKQKINYHSIPVIIKSINIIISSKAFKHGFVSY